MEVKKDLHREWTSSFDGPEFLLRNFKMMRLTVESDSAKTAKEAQDPFERLFSFIEEERKQKELVTGLSFAEDDLAEWNYQQLTEELSKNMVDFVTDEEESLHGRGHWAATTSRSLVNDDGPKLALPSFTEDDLDVAPKENDQGQHSTFVATISSRSLVKSDSPKSLAIFVSLRTRLSQ